jgi:hypothetical protein
MGFGMLGGMDMIGTSAILVVKFAALMPEKTPYQYPCLAMALGFALDWWRKHAVSAG